MNLNDILTVKIISQDSFGRGVARNNNFVVFVDDAITDEEVTIKIYNVKKNYAEASIIEIIEPSINRRTYDCKYYFKCGGCNIGNQNYDYQLEYKEEKVKKLLNVDKINVIGTNETSYRNKIVLRVFNNRVGLYEQKSNKVINIDRCLISNENINIIIDKLNSFKCLNKIKEITIRSLDKTMISFITYEDIDKEVVKYFKEIDSIYINDKNKHGLDIISVNLLGLNFIVSNNSFFQVNIGGTEKLYNTIIKYSNLKNEDTALDLYCGVGTISLLLTKYCSKVIGIEMNEEAINNANINKENNSINNVEFLCGKVEDIIDENMKIDTLILDPPRSGTDIKTINTINIISPSKIIYVSCNPDTLIRDIKLLNNYKIDDVTIIDMFPNTYHIETVVLMSKIN